MGTLHSAASVIQIHFRYLRHLREAGLRQPPSASQTAQPKEEVNLKLDLGRQNSDQYLNSNELSELELP